MEQVLLSYSLSNREKADKIAGVAPLNGRVQGDGGLFSPARKEP
jgi:hypothetical protein